MSTINEEIWNFLWQFNPKFQKEIPDRLKCIICKGILKKAMQTSCGCKGCYKCINEYLGSESKPCPSGQPECEGTKLVFNSDVHPDNATNKEIMRLDVKCPYDKCPEQDNLRTIAVHVKDCNFRKVQCEKCEEMYVMCYKKDHDNKDCSERNMTCQWCNKTMIFRVLQERHLNVDDGGEELCSKYLGYCPNKCGATGDKKVLIKNHLMECKNKKVECPYKCEAPSMTMNDLQVHLKDSEVTHIKSLKIIIQELTDDVKKSKTEINQLKDMLKENMNSKKTMSQSMLSMETTINELKSRCESLEKSGGPSRPIGSSTVSAVIFRGASYIWKIDNYSTKRTEASYGSGGKVSITSDPFYTSEFGYKMCLRVYPAGDGVGRNTHLSVFFAIMKGDYDDLLSWPFKQKVTLSLLEHDGNSKHHSDTFKPDTRSACYHKPTDDCNIASGSPKFIQLSSLDPPSNFCKNDTIYIKIAVDVVGISRP